MIYGYLRVSTDKQDSEAQKEGIVQLAARHGWTIDDWINDDGVSGTKDPDKRELGELMKKCRKGDIIICSELSRLGRKLLMVMSILEYCMKNEIMVYTVKDNYVLGDNIQSTVLAFAFSLASQIERDMISMRTKESLALKRKQGVLLGYPRGINKAIYLTEEQIERMRYLLEEEGKSLSAIAREMKIHRLTVGYHLTRLGIYKGQAKGIKIKYANGNEITLTKKNCIEYGLYYDHIKKAILKKTDLSIIGIQSAEVIYGEVSIEIKELYNESSHPDIDRKFVELQIMNSLTIPEIHAKINSDKVDYDTLYDYIQEDTTLALAYRERGHLRVKSIKKK